MLEAFVDFCAALGFVVAIGLVMLVIVCLFNDVKDHIKDNRTKKERQYDRIKEARRQKVYNDNLMAYYELQAKDACQDIKPNADLLAKCNWD